MPFSDWPSKSSSNPPGMPMNIESCENIPLPTLIRTFSEWKMHTVISQAWMDEKDQSWGFTDRGSILKRAMKWKRETRLGMRKEMTRVQGDKHARIRGEKKRDEKERGRKGGVRGEGLGEGEAVTLPNRSFSAPLIPAHSILACQYECVCLAASLYLYCAQQISCIRFFMKGSLSTKSSVLRFLGTVWFFLLSHCKVS